MLLQFFDSLHADAHFTICKNFDKDFTLIYFLYNQILKYAVTNNDHSDLIAYLCSHCFVTIQTQDVRNAPTDAMLF